MKTSLLPKRIALFAGSFDPFTIGHEAIVKRGLQFFDEVIVGIGINPNKSPMFTESERLEKINHFFNGDPRVRAIIYEGYTIDAAALHHATALLRGVRNSADFEYEQNIANVNRQLSAERHPDIYGPQGIETVILIAEPALEGVSSTAIRQEIAGKGTI